MDKLSWLYKKGPTSFKWKNGEGKTVVKVLIYYIPLERQCTCEKKQIFRHTHLPALLKIQLELLGCTSLLCDSCKLFWTAWWPLWKSENRNKILHMVMNHNLFIKHCTICSLKNNITLYVDFILQKEGFSQCFKIILICPLNKQEHFLFSANLLAFCNQWEGERLISSNSFKCYWNKLNHQPVACNLLF